MLRAYSRRAATHVKMRLTTTVQRAPPEGFTETALCALGSVRRLESSVATPAGYLLLPAPLRDGCRAIRPFPAHRPRPRTTRLNSLRGAWWRCTAAPNAQTAEVGCGARWWRFGGREQSYQGLPTMVAPSQQSGLSHMLGSQAGFLGMAQGSSQGPGGAHPLPLPPAACISRNRALF